MKSKYARKTLSETPLEVIQNVIKIGNEMMNLQKLAERKALEKFPNRLKEDIQYDFNADARKGFTEGFLAHAKLAAEDKKELLEALKLAMENYDGYEHERDSIFEVIEKHETI